MRLLLTFLLATTGLWAQPRWEAIRQFGGSELETVAGMARDPAGNLYVAGNTKSLDFPATLLQTRPGGASLYRLGAESGWTPLLAQRAAEVWAMAADPNRPGVLYAFTNRGLQRTTDRGENWTALPQGLPADANLGSLVVDPFDSAILYAPSARYGLFRSTDSGESWALFSDSFVATRPRRYFPSLLAVDPHHPGHMIAARDVDEDAIHLSVDGGASWERVEVGLWAVAYDPVEPNVVWGTDRHTILRSGDGGRHWEPVHEIDSQRGLDDIAVDGAGNIYASHYDFVLASRDRGASWSQISVEGVHFSSLAADPASALVYVSGSTGTETRLIGSTDGFSSWFEAGGTGQADAGRLTLAPGRDGSPADLYMRMENPGDGFVAKLDADARVVWATYLGGSGSENIVGVATDDDGNVYVAGTTGSGDFPFTADAYQVAEQDGSFITKLSPDGEMVYSSHAAGLDSPIRGLAVDAQGAAYVVGTSYGGLETTPGVVDPDPPKPVWGGLWGVPVFPSTEGFALKLAPGGDRLEYATYLGEDTVSANAVAVGSDGSAYIADGRRTSSSPHSRVLKLDPAAASFLYNVDVAGWVTALALDEDGLVATGSTDTPVATAGAFQTTLGTYFMGTGDRVIADDDDGFLMRLAADDGDVLAATLLGGETGDFPAALALDGNGDAVVAGATSSLGLPTRMPIQSAFSSRTGFVAKLDASFSELEWSTMAGDQREFEPTAVAIGDDGVYFAGSTVEQPDGDVSVSDAFVVKIAVDEPGAGPRLDSVRNAASLLAGPLAPGEIVEATGAGFGDDALLKVGGVVLTTVSQTANRIVALIPNNADREAAAYAWVESGGARSNAILMPTAEAAPGIFTVNGTGFGQGLILNDDGTLNSEDNRAAPGSIVTIAVTGLGRTVVESGETWPAAEENVYIGHWWTPVVGGEIRELPDAPGQVLLLRVPVPDPHLDNEPDFQIPADVAVNVEAAGGWNQPGVLLHLTER